MGYSRDRVRGRPPDEEETAPEGGLLDHNT